MQMLQYGYLELMYLLNPNSPVFQDQVARSSSGLSCNKTQEVHHKGISLRGVHATAAWDSAPSVKLMFPKELNFTFAVRSMAAAFAEAAAPTGVHAATPTAAAVAAAAVSVTQLQTQSSGLPRGVSSTELAAQASGALLHATSGTIGSGGLRNEVFAVLSWIRATLPVLPALCTLGVAAHLLGDAVFDGQPQPERNDSSAADVQYTVRYSPLRESVRYFAAHDDSEREQLVFGLHLDLQPSGLLVLLVGAKATRRKRVVLDVLCFFWVRAVGHSPLSFLSCSVVSVLQVYAARRRQESLLAFNSRRDASAARGRDGGAQAGPFRSPAWKRSPSAEAISEESKGWHGDGPLDARSKCFTDEHAFVVS